MRFIQFQKDYVIIFLIIFMLGLVDPFFPKFHTAPMCCLVIIRQSWTQINSERKINQNKNLDGRPAQYDQYYELLCSLQNNLLANWQVTKWAPSVPQ
jgi:hypothetical protein